MKHYNLIVVYDVNGTKLLMCERKKEPFKGQLNLVGGQVEKSDSLSEAYRELEEETGINKDSIDLIHFMDFTYHYYDILLEVFVGQLKEEVQLVEEVNKLLWVDENENFYSDKYAGDGNIGHIIKQIVYDKAQILGKS